MMGVSRNGRERGDCKSTPNDLHRSPLTRWLQAL
jgi:hypothetical protein